MDVSKNIFDISEYMMKTKKNGPWQNKIPKNRILFLGSSSIKLGILHKSQSSPNTF